MWVGLLKGVEYLFCLGWVYVDVGVGYGDNSMLFMLVCV